MLRAGVGLPADEFTRSCRSRHDQRYLDVTLTDLKREFQRARSKPRHLTPQPKTPMVPLRNGLNGVIDALFGAQHVLEMFRRTLPDGATRTHLDRLSNRLTKILAEVKSITNGSDRAEIGR
jgi:hypothetical protein